MSPQRQGRGPPPFQAASGSLEPVERTRSVRTRLSHPAIKVLGALLLLAVLGMVTGQILGHLLVTGIENLLDIIASDQTG